MQCKERLEAYLRQNKVAFESRRHPEAFTAQEVAANEHIPGKLLAKVVMVYLEGRMAMLVLPAPYRVDLAKVSEELGGQEVRLAREDEFAGLFEDCEVGAMPPFGNLYNLPIYVDRLLIEDETIVFQAGTHRDVIFMKYADYERLVKPTVLDLAALAVA
ncbi:MAG TPA: YbaK/EbsC family protein [Dehalococcoidia bacterium]|nr:YbaK/EbsC family protein [Dehalococcoidia bacterium]